MFEYFGIFRKFNYIVDNNKKVFPIIILVSIANSFIDVLSISLLIPFLSILFFDENSINLFQFFLNNFEKDLIILYSGILIIITFFLKIFVATYLYYYLTNFSLSFQRDLRIKILQKFQNIDFKEYTKSKMSNYFELITNLAPIFSSEVLMPLLKIVTNLVLLIFLGSLLIFTNPKVFLILFLFLTLLTLFYLYFSKRNKLFGKKASLANENFLKSIKETINGYLEILILGKKEFLLNRSKKYSKENVQFSLKTLILQFITKYVIEFFLVAFFILFIFFIYFFNQSELQNTLNTIIIYVAVSLRLIPSFNIIMSSIVSINFGVFSIERIYSHLLINDGKKNEKKIEFDKSKDEKIDLEIKLDFDNLVFKNVYFEYEKDKSVIKNLNIEIKRNEIIGISGPSGTGKTTILNLILGLIKPTAGSIKINKDHNLDDKLYSWHRIISFMPQDIFTINDTISKNISLKESLNEKEIQRLLASLKSVGLESVINSLPKGIDSEVEEMGRNFSGGQKQRIALARAIYHNRDIFILDEVTSSLDSENTKKIINLLLELKKTKTIIISSHNKNILNACDNVIKTN